MLNGGVDSLARAGVVAALAAAGAARLPAGTIIDFAGVAAPAGFLACPLVPTDISRALYPDLFVALGTTWGAGDGVTTFGMPWFPADYAGVQANANVGTSTVGEVIAHTHVDTCAGISGNNGGTGPGTPDIQTVGITGSSGGAANLAAGVRVLKCVKI